AHDELEMRDVIALFGTDHQKFILMGGSSVQAISSIKHEYLERGDTVVEDKMFHFIDVPRLNRGHVITIIDPESPLGLLENFRHELPVWPAAVQVIMPRSDVVEALGHPSHRRRLSFPNLVVGDRRIDADMHVGINTAPDHP